MKKGRRKECCVVVVQFEGRIVMEGKEERRVTGIFRERHGKMKGAGNIYEKEKDL